MCCDAAIIGTGPAGLSAAINLKLRNKSVLWFGTREASEKIKKTGRIKNYPGFPSVTGEELCALFLSHADELGIEITERIVTNIMPSYDSFMILAENEIFQARCLLLCTGVSVRAEFTGEEELLGKGVSYCATCDGFLYRGKDIAVFCKSPRFEHDAADLAGIANRVYVSAPYKGCSPDLPNVELLDAPIKCVCGEEHVNAIKLSDGREIPVDGLFCLRDSVPVKTLLPGLKTDGPHIVTDREMKTNIPGCFAAGDCTGRPYQIAKAVGEGNIAAHSMLEYLAEK